MESSTHSNIYGSSQQADFTAEPPKNIEAPWQAPVSHKGENEWDGSKESRDHPEWNTTAYGTTNRWEQHPPSTESPSSDKQQQQHQQQQHQHGHTDSNMEAGHTVQHPRSSRSIRRDLNNI
ncbi:hypothetical protein BC941DRAFT_467892 [Chlamydoabsidia padenii]|nr:hypothetical protein BC941DRAFT_467892 [Chlamydoabsidia padenii]